MLYVFLDFKFVISVWSKNTKGEPLSRSALQNILGYNIDYTFTTILSEKNCATTNICLLLSFLKSCRQN